MVSGLGLGTFRFVLAMFVAVTHLWAAAPHGFAAYAVWGFFALSGFLMTCVLLDKYGFSAAGLRAYATNRFLRIFPPYYAALLLGMVAVWWLRSRGVDPTQLNPEFGIPHSAQGWLFPLTLFPGFGREAMPIAVANALGIEVGFYLLMPFMARWRAVAWAFLVCGLGQIAWFGLRTESFALRYATFWPCCLAFALGALVAHYRSSLRRVAMPGASVALWLTNSLAWFRWSAWPWKSGLYVATLLSAWVVVSVHERPQSRLDRWLGDLSYPVYLLHTVCGGFAMLAIAPVRGAAFALFSLLLTLAMSVLFVVLLDRPLQRIKRKPVLPVAQSLAH